MRSRLFVIVPIILIVLFGCANDEDENKMDTLLLGTWQTQPENDDPDAHYVINTLTIREQSATLVSDFTDLGIDEICTTVYDLEADASTMTVTIVSRNCNGDYSDSAVGEESTWEYQVTETTLVVINVDTQVVGEYVRIG